MQTLYQALPSRSGIQANAKASRPLSRPMLMRRPKTVVAFLENGKEEKAPKGQSMLPLSIFTPYTQLPPEGKVAHPADAACDPTVSRCKTLIYIYEEECVACSGTGYVKRSARRASLCTCLVCHGLGYVRHTTARYTPDAEFTVGRPNNGTPNKSGAK